MKLIKLTQNKNTLVDDEEYENLSKYKWFAVKARQDSDIFYACRKHNKRQLFMHRQILQLDSTNIVDHIDGNGLNNQKSNLRSSNTQQNARNSKISKRNKTGFKGVRLLKSGKYSSSIYYNNKNITLGVFDSKEGAAKAYNEAAIKYFGEFARLNIL